MVIAYVAYQFSITQLKYAVIEKEVYAVFHALQSVTYVCMCHTGAFSGTKNFLYIY